MIKNKKLKRRIVSISYKYKLAHIGSCLSAVDIIADIYEKMQKRNESFVLSCGHAGLALYVVLEKFKGKNAEKLWLHHGTHPDKCDKCGIAVSSGSLGHGIGISVGMAMADKTRKVHCLLSDGEMSEGSVLESLRIAASLDLTNLNVYVNWNGYGAYKTTGTNNNYDGLGVLFNTKAYSNLRIWFEETTMNDYPLWLQGQIAHYKVLNEQEYNELMELLK